jgi:Hypervirulence associated proteins TUDOR domain
MPKTFKTGDHVRWNSEAGRVSGIIIKKITADTNFKGYTHHASREEPQYLIKSDKTDHSDPQRHCIAGGLCEGEKVRQSEKRKRKR